jgi:hypothetical protein
MYCDDGAHDHMDIKLLAPTMTFMGICVSIILWNLNQKRKALSFAILWNRPLLNLKGVAREQMDIFFKGKQVAEADLIVVRVFNSGHLPIHTGDYQTALTLELEPGASILDANVIETLPANLEERLKIKSDESPLIESIEESKILLRPILLNEGDSFTLQMLVLNAYGKVKVTGHVLGVNNVKVFKDSQLVPIVLTQVGVVIMALAMLTVEPRDIIALAFEHILPFILLFLLGYVLLSAGIYWPRKNFRNLA